ncbi:MAG TPA: S9 family peptidase [Usitatibacter sp.]|nr:S9 family peptidase [Usitatibacter sp.]
MARKRLTVEDLWKIDRVSQPTMSPDGAQACVSVSSFDMEENKGRASLWLLSAFGGEPRRLTSAGEKDGEPKWSPDGRWIAFVAKRPPVGEKKEGDKRDPADDEAQVYLIAPDGGEAKRLTSMPTGCFGIKWFPDSRRIAFISWVWPDTKLARLAKRYQAHKDDKVKAHVAEHSAYRWWDHWLTDGRVAHVLTVDVDTGKVRDLFEGSRYELVAADASSLYYDIAPDGREIAFAFDPAEDKRFDHDTQMVALDLASGKFRTLTRGSPLSHEEPSYSPDGRYIAWLAQDRRKSPIVLNRLALYDRRRERVEVVSNAWDRSVHAPLRWSRDSKTILFAAESDARQNLYRWTPGKRKPEMVAKGGSITEFDAAGDSIVFVRNDMSTPPQAFSLGTAKGERRIDRFNDEVMSGVRLGDVREIHVEGFGKDQVQAWVVYPPDFDPKRKWPLLHNIHGGPHNIWGDNFHFRWNNQAFAAMGYVVVCVNYHGSSSFGERYMQSIEHELGKRELADVEAVTDFMLKEGYIDRDRLSAAGGSYGGYMVAWMNGLTDRYKAFVCHAGCFDWVSMFSGDAWYWFPKELGAWYWDDMKKVESQNPRAKMKPIKTPTLVIHGALDYRVPGDQGLQYYNTLKAKEVPARLVFFPDENHWILKPQNSRLWYREVEGWLDRYVKPGARKGAKKAR